MLRRILLHWSERVEAARPVYPARAITATKEIGAWLSLVEHLLREQGVGGSNPLAPTIPFLPEIFFEHSPELAYTVSEAWPT